MNRARDQDRPPEPVVVVTAQAANELARLQRQVGQTREVLARLRQDLANSGSSDGGTPGGGLIEAARQPAGSTLRPPIAAEEAAPAHAEEEHLNAQLKEATQHLIIAALNAQKLQDAAEQARQRQTEFMAVLAHELRNPLAPIRTAAELLGRLDEGDPLLKRARAIIERQVEHMTRLVSDLFDISHATTGKLSLERHRIDISGVVDEAVSACKPAMDKRLQQLVVQLPQNSPQINGDPVRLVQILSNLLDNASKYTPEGGEIGLSVTLGNEEFLLIVTDNGIGITAEALPRIFEPFVRTPQRGVEAETVGLGIGLTLVRELVEAHGGQVVARSAGKGAGSRFAVTLPLSGGAGGSDTPGAGLPGGH